MKINDIKSKIQLVLIEILNHKKNNFGIRQYKILSAVSKAINNFPNNKISDVYLTVSIDDKERKFRYIDSITFSNENGISAKIENIDYSHGSDLFEVEYLKVSDIKGKAKIEVLLDNKEDFDFNYWLNDIMGLLSDENVEIKIEEYWVNID